MKTLIIDNYNYILLAAIISWASAQIIKTFLNFITTNKFNAERLIGSGGMPSSHSSFVCSATMATGRSVGVSSPLFAIIFILAMVVMYDAMGVRWAAGLHAKEINKMNRMIGDNTEFKDNNFKMKGKELKEFLGHTPFEVLAGALLGIIIALLLPVKI